MDRLGWGIFIGFVVGLMIAGMAMVKFEKHTWNLAVDKSSGVILNNTNKFGGLDQTYDLGYKRCQEEGFDLIRKLKRD